MQIQAINNYTQNNECHTSFNSVKKKIFLGQFKNKYGQNVFDAMMNIDVFKEYVKYGSDFNIALSEKFSKNNKRFKYSKEGLTLQVKISKDKYEYGFKKALSKILRLKKTLTFEQYFPDCKSLSEDIVNEFIKSINSNIFNIIYCKGKIWMCVKETKIPTSTQTC